VFALFLGVIPDILRGISERGIAIRRCHTLLFTIQMVVKKYRFYKPQKLIQDNITQYQYHVSNVQEMCINIDLYQEAKNLNLLSENLKSKIQIVVTETVDLLVAISSGFPFDEKDWDRLESLISKSIETLEKELG
jgi:hypothetical protein